MTMSAHQRVHEAVRDMHSARLSPLKWRRNGPLISAHGAFPSSKRAAAAPFGGAERAICASRRQESAKIAASRPMVDVRNFPAVTDEKTFDGYFAPRLRSATFSKARGPYSPATVV